MGKGMFAIKLSCIKVAFGRKKRLLTLNKQQTRSLAREEFLKKALIKKISKGMGLVDGDRWR